MLLSVDVLGFWQVLGAGFGVLLLVFLRLSAVLDEVEDLLDAVSVLL